MPRKQNLNTLQKNLFKVIIQPKEGYDTRSIEFYTKTVPIPGITQQVTDIESRVATISYPSGGKPKHMETINIGLQLDDKLINYFDLYKWSSSIASLYQTKGEFEPDKYNVIKENIEGIDRTVKWAGQSLQKLVAADLKTPVEWTPLDYRDILIELKDTNQVVFGYVLYQDCWPEIIPEFEMDVKSSDPIYIEVRLRYLTHQFLNANKELIA